jgi:hypothetical protein
MLVRLLNCAMLVSGLTLDCLLPFQGTLHFHLVFYGGLPPYLLQRFANLKALCDAITKALDTMYKAYVDPKTHAAVLSHKILRECNTFDLDPSTLGPAVAEEPLLSRPRPLEIVVNGKLAHKVLDDAVDHQAARQENHKHMLTCRTGFLGLTGCRLCMPAGQKSETGPVRLIAASAAVQDRVEAHLPESGSESSNYDEETEDSDSAMDVEEESGEQAMDRCECCDRVVTPTVECTFCREYHAPELGSVYPCHSFKRPPSDPSPNDKEQPRESSSQTGPQVDDPYAYKVMPVPHDPASEVYHHHSPLDNSVKDSIIVWELRRPKLNLASGGEILPSTKNDSGDNLSKETMISRLQSILLEGSPAYDSNSIFWPWLHRLDEDRLSSFYSELSDRLETANGYIAAYNATTSYCTGSHNNYQLLGSQDQAKSAIMYICPYMGKTKYPLMHSLTVLQRALDHVEKYKSVAPDTGSDQRTAKHILTRVLNKMNVCMELSDYQVAACLARLPNHFSSSNYAYGNPDADHSYTTLVQVKERSEQAYEQLLNFLNREEDEVEYQQAVAAGGVLHDFIVEDDDAGPRTAPSDNRPSEQYEAYNKEDLMNLQNIGYLQLFTMRDPSVDRDKDVRMLIPSAALYGTRGKELRDLNRLEFRALVGTRRANADNSRARIKQFAMPPSFAVAAQYAFVLEGKQSTPILTRSPPPHPREAPNQPKDHAEYLQWKEKADIFAKFWLSELHPEPDCYQVTDQNRLAYDWTALTEWVDSCLSSDRIIDTFRLMAMDKRRIGLRSSYVHKAWLSKYRGRDRDLWSSDQKARYAMEEATRRKGYEQNILDNYAFEQSHCELSKRTNNQMNQQIAYSKEQVAEYERVSGLNSPQPSSKRCRASASNVLFTALPAKEIQERAAKLKAWRPPKGTPAPTRKRKRYDSGMTPVAVSNQLSNNLKTSPEQQELFDFYSKYLLNPEDPNCRPPNIVLVHGVAGSGKSTVCEAIDDLTEFLNKKNIKTSFNAINALAIGGNTTASLIQLRPEIHSEHLLPLTPDQLKTFIALTGYDETTMLVLLDEISTQAPFHIARFDLACKQVRNCYDLPFGGLCCVMLGDLHQLGPVKAGPSLTQAVIDVYTHEAEMMANAEERVD